MIVRSVTIHFTDAQLSTFAELSADPSLVPVMQFQDGSGTVQFITDGLASDFSTKVLCLITVDVDGNWFEYQMPDTGWRATE